MFENKTKKWIKCINIKTLPLLSGFLILTVSVAYAEENSCVDCHGKDYTKIALPAWEADSFEVWSESVHGVNGVACNNCHGGDPKAADKEQAHEGVKRSTDPTSPIYYENVPETCGKCHTKVYEKFTQSKHYKNLKAEKLAPTCTTCHGFHMDITKVKPLRISTKCSELCHNKRIGAPSGISGEAKKILVLQKMVGRDISKAHNLIKEAEKEGGDTAEAERALMKADAEFKESWYMWHAFDFSNFQKALLEASDSARSSYSTSLSAIRGQQGALENGKNVCGPSIIMLFIILPLLGRGLIKNGGSVK